MTSKKYPTCFSEEFGGFESLMPNRIHKILMVASLYDSFLLADDDRLNEALLGDRGNDPISIERVPTAEQAEEKLSEENYDLVIAMVQIGETDMGAFFKRLKEGHPDMPVVLLAFNLHDILTMSEKDKAVADGVFLWNGDTRIFSAIIYLIEDRLNFERDSKVGVQAVLLVEDNVKFYSSYLPVIYTELIKQTSIAIADELNPAKKVLRLKARPKILFCGTYEQAWDLYKKYKTNILGVISDIEYPYAYGDSARAGLELAANIKKDKPDMPVLLQSSQPGFTEEANNLGASFMNKNAKDLNRQLRGFMRSYFGFGDFVFNMPDGQVVARASDLSGMLRALKTVPEESLLYHGRLNHFSKWLLARTEFELAFSIRPKKISEFQSTQKLRQYLIEMLYRFIHKNQLGTILKFDRNYFHAETPFVKIGYGAIGGKARGLAFTDFLLGRNTLSRQWPDVTITVPNTIVLATDVFDLFMETNNIEQELSTLNSPSDGQISGLFLKARLPDYLKADLEAVIDTLHGPLAVRSSSLLEDSKNQPFAGIYKTYMLSNNHQDRNARLEELQNAIKLVYSSVFANEATAYRRLNPHVSEEEKMAVIIQKVVGRQYGSDRFYPAFAGVMQSYNYYPAPPLKAEEPIVHIGVGLGKSIVEGTDSLRFSPAHPEAIHQFGTVKDYFGSSQKNFFALDMKKSAGTLSYDTEPAVIRAGVREAEQDGTLELTGSTYSFENEAVYDGIYHNGTKLITFAPVLKNNVIPLAEILNYLSEEGKKAMGSHIEMEFAGDYDPETKETVFNVLQIRPMTSRLTNRKVNIDEVKKENILCRSINSLGNSVFDDIRDFIYVTPENFSNLVTEQIAEEIDGINKKLTAEKREYVIMGPGRWGTSDPFLGIPVKWNNISSARVIVEALYKDFAADPSYGTHFFHNVTSLGIGYLTINEQNEKAYVGWDKIAGLPPAYKGKYITHVRLEKPLDIRIDGNTLRAVISLT